MLESEMHSTLMVLCKNNPSSHLILTPCNLSSHLILIPCNFSSRLILILWQGFGVLYSQPRILGLELQFGISSHVTMPLYTHTHSPHIHTHTHTPTLSCWHTIGLITWIVGVAFKTLFGSEIDVHDEQLTDLVNRLAGENTGSTRQIDSYKNTIIKGRRYS